MSTTVPNQPPKADTQVEGILSQNEGLHLQQFRTASSKSKSESEDENGSDRSRPKANVPKVPRGVAVETSDTWQTVTNRRGTRRRRGGIVGCASDENDVKAAPKVTFLYVSRIDPTTTTDQMHNFLTKDFPEAKCELVTSKFPDRYASFKVIINSENAGKALDPNRWPSGVYVNKFFRKRIPEHEKGAGRP